MRFMILLLLLAGCTQAPVPVSEQVVTPTPGPPGNVSGYRVVKTWQFGQEVMLDRSNAQPIRPEDVREIVRRLKAENAFTLPYTIIFMDSRGEVARYLAKNDNLIFHGED